MASRAANAIKSGTVSSVMAVGNTLVNISPHLTGAIDIVMVRQPDGSLKSSPFYVRFGKYTGMRIPDRKVRIAVNDEAVELSMHLGRTGEAYFVMLDEPAEGGAEQDELLRGQMSPVSGCSSGDDLMAYEQPVGLPLHLSTHNISLASAEEGRAGAMRQHMEHTLSCPANLDKLGSVQEMPEQEGVESPVSQPAHMPPLLEAEPSPDAVPAVAWDFDAPKARSAPSSPRLMTTGLYPASPEVPSMAQMKLAVGMNHPPTAVSPGHSPLFGRVDGSDSAGSSPSAVSSLTASLAALAGIRTREDKAEQSRSDSPSLRGSSRAGLRRHSFESSVAARQTYAPSHVSPRPGKSSASGRRAGVDRLSETSQPHKAHGDLHAASSMFPDGVDRQQRSSRGHVLVSEEHCNKNQPSGKQHSTDAAQARQQPFDVDQLPLQDDPNEPETQRPEVSDAGRPVPTHPWSLANPRHLSTPLATQHPPAIITSKEAAAPVGDGMQSSAPRDTAIPASADQMSPAAPSESSAANNKEALESLQDDSVLQDDAAQFAIHRHQIDMQRREEEPHEARTSSQALDHHPQQRDASTTSATQSRDPHSPHHKQHAIAGSEQDPQPSTSESPASPFESVSADDCPASPQPNAAAQALRTAKAQAAPEGTSNLHSPMSSREGLANGGLKPHSNHKDEKSAIKTATQPSAGFNEVDQQQNSFQYHPHTNNPGPTDSSKNLQQLGSSDRNSSAGEHNLNQSTLSASSSSSPKPPTASPSSANLPTTSGTSTISLPTAALCHSPPPSNASSRAFPPAQLSLPAKSAIIPIRTAVTPAYSEPLPNDLQQASQPTAVRQPLLGSSPEPTAGGWGAAGAGDHLSIADARHSQVSQSLPIMGRSPSDLLGMSPNPSIQLGKAPTLDQGAATSAVGPAAPTPALQDEPTFELSLCAGHIRPGMSPEEAWGAFAAGRVPMERFQSSPQDVMGSQDLMVRVGMQLVSLQDAAPMLVGRLVYQLPDAELEKLMPAAAKPVQLQRPKSLLPGAEPKARQQSKAPTKRNSWRLWFNAWRATSPPVRPQSTSGPALKPADKASSEPLAITPRAPGSAGLGVSQPIDLAAEEAQEVVQLAKVGRKRAFVPTPAQLSQLPLQQGQNTIEFTFAGQRLRAFVYMLAWNARLVISDVDGTITRSDLLGHMLPRIGWDWSHLGIANLFSNISDNGYDMLFLSSRAIAQASATRDYLHTLKQDGSLLPQGPVIISPDGLFPSLYRELVLRRPHEFKIRALEDIRALFPEDWNPFFAGFGNRDTDEISYLTVGVPPSKIFIINPRGELRKASSTVTTSTWGTLIGVNGLVHEMFPPLQPVEQAQSVTQREEYNDFTFWHVQPPIIIDSDEDLDPAAQPSVDAVQNGDLSVVAGDLVEAGSSGAAGGLEESEQLDGYDSTDESGGDTPVKNDLMMTLGSPFPL
ncbi:hypothetical protein WJX74_000895 [Apatococcus lobatus]|uniref:phosphatidate phosphatase n=1 Tax=Apatococcus lobatus TaxID=904363 RepID=A0AAW1SFF1_9CHLO